MTNAQIVLMESIRLMENGIISGSGVFGAYTDGEGNEVRVELPEQIHTFAAWKALGFIVRKGEHAIAAFPVWTYREQRRNGGEPEPNQDGESDARRGKMFLKKAFFFKASQVEKLQCNA